MPAKTTIRCTAPYHQVFATVAKLLQEEGYRIDESAPDSGRLKASKRYHALSLPNERLQLSCTFRAESAEKANAFSLEITAANSDGSQVDPLGKLMKANTLMSEKALSAINLEFRNQNGSGPSATIRPPSGPSPSLSFGAEAPPTVDPTVPPATGAVPSTSSPNPALAKLKAAIASASDKSFEAASTPHSTEPSPAAEPTPLSQPDTPSVGARSSRRFAIAGAVGVVAALTIWGLSGSPTDRLKAELATCAGFYGQAAGVMERLSSSGVAMPSTTAGGLRQWSVLHLSMLHLVIKKKESSQATPSDITREINSGTLAAAVEAGREEARQQFVNAAAGMGTSSDAFKKRDRSCIATLEEAKRSTAN